jgi:hypothetical protein
MFLESVANTHNTEMNGRRWIPAVVVVAFVVCTAVGVSLSTHGSTGIRAADVDGGTSTSTNAPTSNLMVNAMGSVSPSAAPLPIAHVVIVYPAFHQSSWAPNGAFGIDAARTRCDDRRRAMNLACTRSDVLAARNGFALEDLPSSLRFDVASPVMGSNRLQIARSWTDFLNGTLVAVIADAMHIEAGSDWWSGVETSCASWTSTAGHGTVGSLVSLGRRAIELNYVRSCSSDDVTVLCICR